MNTIGLIFLSGVFFFWTAIPADAQFGNVLRTLGIDQKEELSDDTLASGLK